MYPYLASGRELLISRKIKKKFAIEKANIGEAMWTESPANVYYLRKVNCGEWLDIEEITKSHTPQQFYRTWLEDQDILFFLSKGKRKEHDACKWPTSHDLRMYDIS